MENENKKADAIIHKDTSLKRLDLSFMKHIELEEYKKYPFSSIDIGNELYDILNKIYENENKKLSEKYENIWNLPAENIKQFTTDLAYVQKIKEEISRMKKGSIILMDQITTISKQRIFDDDILKKARLSNSSLDLIDNMLKKIFTK